MKKHLYLGFTILFFINWVVFIVLASFYPDIITSIGLGELVSTKIPITIVFGFLIPSVVFAMLYSGACEACRRRAQGKKKEK